VSHKVLISDGMDAEAVETLKASKNLAIDFRKSTPLPDLLKVLPTIECLAIRSATKVTKEVLDAAPNLKLVVRLGAGVDNIDLVAAKAKGVAVMNTASANALSAAEHAIALMFSLARNIPESAASLRKNEWRRADFVGVELDGKTLGILGLGQIGKIVARKAIGLGMKVVGYDPFVEKLKEPELAAVRVLKTIDEVLPLCDWVTLHLPKNKETTNLFNEARLKTLKKGARIVNAARGGIINEKDLMKVLDEGHLAGAALDVFDKEPPEFPNPLFQHAKVLAVPHLGASTFEAQSRVGTVGADRILAFFERGDRSTTLTV
jgi:D-3-phosphoglycerate dehydrogenase / 2-oxoglutarate reductase